MKVRLLFCICLVLAICGGAMAQDWSSGRQTGLTSVNVLQVGGDYTITLNNLSGTAADTNTPDYDVIVWSIELFNFYAPDIDTIVAPTGWTWNSNKFTCAVAPNQKYYTPPSLAPGDSYVFKFHSSAAENNGYLSHNDFGAPVNGIMAHVGAIDPTQPGSATQKWVAVNTPFGPTWGDIPKVPEPGSLLSLAAGLTGIVGLVTRRRK